MMDLHSVSEFVSAHIIPTKNGRKCVDGRYQNDENSGMIARPGADFGYVMAMLSYNNEQKLGLSVEDCVKAVYDAVIAIDGTFYMHTDEHENPELSYAIGCGHAFKATQDEFAMTYGLEPSETQQAISLLKNNTDMPVSMTTLMGEHSEKGVLIVKNDEYTVNSSDGESMYFVYDKKRDDIFIKDLVAKIANDQLVYENFQRVSTLQLGATLQALAKGLPIFEVNIDDSHDIHVMNTGTV